LSARRLVLLYNDKDAKQVLAIYESLKARWRRADFVPWMAHRDLTWNGDLFQQIEGAIHDSLGVIVFLSPHGLGRFQENIEMGAMKTMIWEQGKQFGVLIVHLPGTTEAPRDLRRYASVNYNQELIDEDAIGAEINRIMETSLISGAVE